MTNQIFITTLFVVGFILIIIFNEYLFRKYNLKPEYSRKIAHILACLSSLLFLFSFNSHWNVLFLGLLFFIILYLGKKFNKTKSIDNVKRKTIGSYILPISIYILFFISKKLENNIYFVLPLLILGVSDPLAGFFGTFYENKTKKIIFLNTTFNKTILGSVVFLISSFLISIITLYLFDFEISKTLNISLIIALFATLTEIVSSKGIDNISVPLVTTLIIYIINNS